MTERTSVRIWIDPTCPWAWQTSKWVRQLRDWDVIELEWRLFSLELQALPDAPFDEATVRGGDALRSLALVRAESGHSAFERLYEAIGASVHDAPTKISHDVVRQAARDAGMLEAVGRSATSEWADAVVAESAAARDMGIFGVPTIGIDGAKPLFGPVFARAPNGSDARTMWTHVRWLAEREDFYELKRWRDRKPGA